MGTDYTIYLIQRLPALALLALGIGYIIAVIFTPKFETISRSKYFCSSMLVFLSAAILQPKGALLADATGTWFWIIVAFGLLVSAGAGYAWGTLSLWRATDCGNRRWVALLGLVPLAGLFLLFAPPVKGTRERTRATEVAVILMVGAAAGIGASMIAKPAAETTTSELITSAKTGHMLTCKTTIKNQSDRQNLGLSEGRIEAYCGCLAAEYFDSLSTADFEAMQDTGQIPARVLQRREQIQATCFDKIAATRRGASSPVFAN